MMEGKRPREPQSSTRPVSLTPPGRRPMMARQVDMSSAWRPFNIMFVTPAFVYGGLERVILDLIAAMDRERFSPMICSLYPPAPGMVPRLEAAGVPIVATNAGGDAKVLGGGKYGTLIPAADPAVLAAALRRVLDDPAASRRIAEEARAHVFAERTHIAMARKYDELFESLLTPNT